MISVPWQWGQCRICIIMISLGWLGGCSESYTPREHSRPTPLKHPPGTDHGRLFINEARTGVMAWWSMGRWTDRAAREAIIAHAMTMTLADFRRWFARHEATFLVD